MRFALMSMPRFLMTRTAFGMQRLRVAPRARGLDRPGDRCSRSASAICERALLPVHRNKHPRPAARPVARGTGDSAEPQRRDGTPRPPRAAVPTTSEIDRVVAVTAVGGAATREHEPAVTEQTEVVRDQALRLADQLRQLPHRPIALGQRLQQPPAHGMRHEPHELGQLSGDVA